LINPLISEAGFSASTIAQPSSNGQQKQLTAAQDFEALLIGQMLHSMRESGSSWLGTGDDEAGATAFGFGEDQLAKALTKGGGLGLSKVIATGLAVKSAASQDLLPSAMELGPTRK